MSKSCSARWFDWKTYYKCYGEIIPKLSPYTPFTCMIISLLNMPYSIFSHDMAYTLYSINILVKKRKATHIFIIILKFDTIFPMGAKPWTNVVAIWNVQVLHWPSYVFYHSVPLKTSKIFSSNFNVAFLYCESINISD